MFNEACVCSHVSSPVALNEVTPNSTNSQVPPPASVTDTSLQRNSNNAIYEDVTEQTPRIDIDPSYVITQCPAYASLSTEHGQKKAGM